ncbi:helix-turn-helix domain-containing protein [Nocardia sp. 004]|uniref:helix-turn-helix domain-containing protein n=1 Tax=Nocardia sp. 004 TaxID=3385978 RepID=UPI00399FC90D
MTLLREAIGDSLRRARLAQHRTLREVSTSARVSLGYLSEVERGRKEASSELLAAICEALDLPLSRVLWDVSTVMADTDGRSAGVPADAAVAPAESTAEPARDAARQALSLAEDTRIVIPAPRSDTLVLVKDV